MIRSTRVIAGAVLIVLGIGWLLQTAGLIHVDPKVIGPVILIAIGVALVIGAPRGLHVPLFVGGIILAIILAGDSSDIHLGSTRSRGTAVESPASASDLHPYHLGAGNLEIDLRLLPLDGETYRVSANVGTGRLNVFVPPGTSAVVTARTGVGSSNVFGRRSSGASTRSVVRIDYSGRTKYVINLRVGAGTIRVVHRRA